MKLVGVDSVEAAMRLRERIVYVDRNDVRLPEGRYFVQDLIGMTVYYPALRPQYRYIERGFEPSGRRCLCRAK